MTGKNSPQQQNGRDFGEFGWLHIDGADADPALRPQSRGSHDTHGDQAKNRQAVNRDQKRLQPVQRKTCEGQGDQGTNTGCDPVVIPIGVVGLALGAGNQHARDGHHGQRDAPEDPLPGSLASSAAGGHRQAVAVTCCSTRCASP